MNAIWQRSSQTFAGHLQVFWERAAILAVQKGARFITVTDGMSWGAGGIQHNHHFQRSHRKKWRSGDAAVSHYIKEYHTLLSYTLGKRNFSLTLLNTKFMVVFLSRPSSEARRLSDADAPRTLPPREEKPGGAERH